MTMLKQYVLAKYKQQRYMLYLRASMNVADFEGQLALITFQPFRGPVEG